MPQLFGATTGSPSANEKTLAGTLADQTLGGRYYLNSAYSLAGVDNLNQVERKHGRRIPRFALPRGGTCPSASCSNRNSRLPTR